MSDIDEQGKEVLMRRVVSGFMKDQLADLKEYSKEDNNSFIFLEKGTLNLLIAYMLSGDKRSTNEEVNEEFKIRVLKEIDQVIENNKKEFEDVINLLKELK